MRDRRGWRGRDHRPGPRHRCSGAPPLPRSAAPRLDPDVGGDRGGVPDPGVAGGGAAGAAPGGQPGPDPPAAGADHAGAGGLRPRRPVCLLVRPVHGEPGPRRAQRQPGGLRPALPAAVRPPDRRGGPGRGERAPPPQPRGSDGRGPDRRPGGRGRRQLQDRGPAEAARVRGLDGPSLPARTRPAREGRGSDARRVRATGPAPALSPHAYPGLPGRPRPPGPGPRAPPGGAGAARGTDRGGGGPDARAGRRGPSPEGGRRRGGRGRRRCRGAGGGRGFPVRGRDPRPHGTRLRSTLGPTGTVAEPHRRSRPRSQAPAGHPRAVAGGSAKTTSGMGHGHGLPGAAAPARAGRRGRGTRPGRQPRGPGGGPDPPAPGRRRSRPAREDGGLGLPPRRARVPGRWGGLPPPGGAQPAPPFGRRGAGTTARRAPCTEDGPRSRGRLESGDAGRRRLLRARGDLGGLPGSSPGRGRGGHGRGCDLDRGSSGAGGRRATSRDRPGSRDLRRVRPPSQPARGRTGAAPEAPGGGRRPGTHPGTGE